MVPPRLRHWHEFPTHNTNLVPVSRRLTAYKHTHLSSCAIWSACVQHLQHADNTPQRHWLATSLVAPGGYHDRHGHVQHIRIAEREVTQLLRGDDKKIRVANVLIENTSSIHCLGQCCSFERSLVGFSPRGLSSGGWSWPTPR